MDIILYTIYTFQPKDTRLTYDTQTLSNNNHTASKCFAKFWRSLLFRGGQNKILVVCSQKKIISPVPDIIQRVFVVPPLLSFDNTRGLAAG